MPPNDIADKLIFTTPRALAVTLTGLLTGGLAIYGLIATTFVPKTEYDQYTAMSTQERRDIANRQINHEYTTEIYRLGLSRASVDDQLWLVEQRILEPTGDTRDNRDRKQDLLRRKNKITEQIHCMQTGSNFCMPSANDL